MSDFLTWALPIACSSIISTVIGLLIKHQFDSYLEKKEAAECRKDADQKELEEYRAKERKQELEKTIQSAVDESQKAIIEKIEDLSKSLHADEKATVLNLRVTMKRLRDSYKAQGFADASDIATWNELYEQYKDMGGNHFSQWVDQWKNEVNSFSNNLYSEKES